MVLKRVLELAGASVLAVAAVDPARICLFALAYRGMCERYPELFDGIAAGASIDGQIAELTALEQLVA